jgi:hypothetical protein
LLKAFVCDLLTLALFIPLTFYNALSGQMLWVGLDDARLFRYLLVCLVLESLLFPPSLQSLPVLFLCDGFPANAPFSLFSPLPFSLLLALFLGSALGFLPSEAFWTIDLTDACQLDSFRIRWNCINLISPDLVPRFGTMCLTRVMCMDDFEDTYEFPTLVKNCYVCGFVRLFEDEPMLAAHGS